MVASDLVLPLLGASSKCSTGVRGGLHDLCTRQAVGWESGKNTFAFLGQCLVCGSQVVCIHLLTCMNII